MVSRESNVALSWVTLEREGWPVRGGDDGDDMRMSAIMQARTDGSPVMSPLTRDLDIDLAYEWRGQSRKAGLAQEAAAVLRERIGLRSNLSPVRPLVHIHVHS